MFKLKKCTDLRKILVHVEFDGSKISTTKVVAGGGGVTLPHSCPIQDSRCSTVPGLLYCIFCFMWCQMQSRPRSPRLHIGWYEAMLL